MTHKNSPKCDCLAFGGDFLLAGLVAVLQAHRAVEDQMVRGAVLAVGAEVAQTEELVGGRSLGVFQAGFHLAAGEHLQGVGVQAAEEVLAGGVGIGIVKQVIVLTDLGLAAVVGIHPVDGCALDLPAVGGVAPLGGGVVGGQHLHHVAVCW